MLCEILVLGVDPLDSILDVQPAVNEHHDRSAQAVQRLPIDDGLAWDELLTVDLYLDKTVVFDKAPNFSNRDAHSVGGFFKGQNI